MSDETGEPGAFDTVALTPAQLRKLREQAAQQEAEAEGSPDDQAAGAAPAAEQPEPPAPAADVGRPPYDPSATRVLPRRDDPDASGGGETTGSDAMGAEADDEAFDAGSTVMLPHPRRTGTGGPPATPSTAPSAAPEGGGAAQPGAAPPGAPPSYGQPAPPAPAYGQPPAPAYGQPAPPAPAYGQPSQAAPPGPPSTPGYVPPAQPSAVEQHGGYGQGAPPQGYPQTGPQPQAPPQGYGHTGPQAPAPQWQGHTGPVPQQPKLPTSTVAVVAAICGGISLFTFFIPFLGFILAIAGVVLGMRGLAQIRTGHYGGKPGAWVGIVAGALGGLGGLFFTGLVLYGFLVAGF